MIIALSAFKFSGKDTVADYLVQNHGFKRIAFADPLKDRVAEQFGISRESLDHPSQKESPILSMPVDPKDGHSKMIVDFMVKEFRTKEKEISQAFFIDSNQGLLLDAEERPIYKTLYWTPRALAILIGSTCRSVDSSYWVKQAIAKIKAEKTGNVVISDLRYKSEVNQLKEEFGEELITIRINRFENSPSHDPSELDLADYKHDFTINNKGTKEEFFEKINDLLIKK